MRRHSVRLLSPVRDMAVFSVIEAIEASVVR